MRNNIVETFRRRLDKLNISDFHGLISPGLTCYLNSVLQVLFMTEEFRDRIKRCSDDATTLDIHLKGLFTTMETTMAKTHDFSRILGIADVYEQRDAAEYFEKILRLTSPEASKIFKGELNHMTTCRECNTRNNAPGFFWILPLSIKDPHQTYRVDKGIEDFFSKEKVTGENKIYCTQCNKKQDAFVMCEMRQPPEVLTLLLKRFHYDYDLKCNVKVDCEAEVPLILKMKECIYELYAMVKHYGNLNGGHYIANIFSSQTKVWYSFNDERVKVTNNYRLSRKPNLRSRSSYLLMYMKKSGNPENISENKEETPDAEAEETHIALIKELMESKCNRESHGQEDYKTDMDTVLQIKITRPNSPLNSSLKGNHTEWKSLEFQDRLPNKEIFHNRNVKTVSPLDRQKSAHHQDKYSPKTNTRQMKATKFETSKPWK